VRYPRRWRHSAALLVLCLTVLGPPLLLSPLPTWTAGVHQARCVGPCCLIADGFVELSCGKRWMARGTRRSSRSHNVAGNRTRSSPCALCRREESDNGDGHRQRLAVRVRTLVGEVPDGGRPSCALPSGQLTAVPIAQLTNPEIPHPTNPKSPRMTDATGETWLYGEGSARTPSPVSEGTAMRVVLADHQADVRSALRLLVTHVLGLQVVGEVTAAADLWTQVQDAGPDLLLLEWSLLGPGVGAALARLHAVYPDLQVIVLSGHPEARQHALASGADAFVSKADSPEQMLKTLRAARARGGTGRATGDGTMTEGSDE
jgi:CheY-like chemotaxis protein